MRKLMSNIWKVLIGEQMLTDRQKYGALISAVAMVHVVLFCLFVGLQIMPLYLFNIGSVISYMVATLLIRAERFLPVYLITYAEIILHSLMATIFIGWSFGFGQYIIAIIPVSFYLCYTMRKMSHRLSTAIVTSLLAMIAFIAFKLYSCHAEPVYSITDPNIETTLYIFNSVCTFTFLMALSLLFVYEVRITNAKLRHQNAILDQLANTDPLTGLYNRRSMNLFLEQASRSHSDFHIIMCDIDDFKKVNDNYGHDFGDIVLQEIAEITIGIVEDAGYVCRWGGEEILILINNQVSESVYNIAESIRSHVEHHIFELNQKLIHCTLTMGIAAYHESDTIEETITRADDKLYRGKRSGNRVGG